MVIPPASNIGLLLGLGFAVHDFFFPKPAKDIHSERVSAAPLPSPRGRANGTHRNAGKCHVMSCRLSRSPIITRMGQQAGGREGGREGLYVDEEHVVDGEEERVQWAAVRRMPNVHNVLAPAHIQGETKQCSNPPTPDAPPYLLYSEEKGREEERRDRGAECGVRSECRNRIEDMFCPCFRSRFETAVRVSE